jgi:hypothetical protein
MQRDLSEQPQLLSHATPFVWTTLAAPECLGHDPAASLSQYLVARATIQWEAEGADTLWIERVIERVKTLGDPMALYEVQRTEHRVELWLRYDAVRLGSLQEPYDCHLAVKTSTGTQVLTIPAPHPPCRQDWQQLIEGLWQAGILPAALAQRNQRTSQQARERRAVSELPEIVWRDQPVQHPKLSRQRAWKRELSLATSCGQPGAIEAQLLVSGVGVGRDQPVSRETVQLPALPSVPDDAPVGEGATPTGSIQRQTTSIFRRRARLKAGQWAWGGKALALVCGALALAALGLALLAAGVSRQQGSTANLPFATAISLASSTPASATPAQGNIFPTPSTGTGQITPVPGVTNSPRPSATPRSPTATANPSPTATGTATPSPTATATPSPTATPSSTATPSPSPTATPF